jgi:hypothetical protein
MEYIILAEGLNADWSIILLQILDFTKMGSESLIWIHSGAFMTMTIDPRYDDKKNSQRPKEQNVS